MRSSPDDFSLLPSGWPDARVDETCERFEALWSSGAEPCIDDFLGAEWSEDPAALRALLAELVIVDLKYRWRPRGADTPHAAVHQDTRSGKPGLPSRPLLSDYQARYPALGTPDQWPIRLIVEEYKVRRKWGDGPDPEEYLSQYRDRADELARRLKEVDHDLARGARSDQPAALSGGTAGKRVWPISLAEFVEGLSQSGLMSADEVAAFQGSLPPERRPRDAAGLAEELVRSGKLTEYQVRRIREGEAKGLAFGQYVVLDEIGAGGMGQVFKVRHRSMDRIVALKVLPPRFLDSPEAVKRFQREARAAAKLSHPNIVTAHDAGRHDDLHYLVMEYVEGEDLGRVVQRHGPLPIAEAIDCLLQVARGLQYAHQQGVIHRDIKPGNLLLDTQGVVKILDMGLARLDASAGSAGPPCDEHLTATGMAMGTIAYMAPEQAEDPRQADQRSDIYSLGCTLWHLVLGKPPFEGSTAVQMLLAHRESPIPSLRAARPEVPEALDGVVGKMLAKRPEDRYQSMAEVIEALEAVAASCASAVREETVVLTDGPGAPATIRSPEPPVPGGQPAHRPLARILVGGIAAVVVLASIVLAGWQLWQHRTQPEVSVERAVLFVRRHGDDGTIKKLTLRRGAEDLRLLFEPLRPDDDFKLQVEFSRPTWWCLAWLDTKGKVQIEAEAERPEKAAGYPAGNFFMPVDPSDPAGRHLLVVLVSDRPLEGIRQEIVERLGEFFPLPDVPPDQYVQLRGAGQPRATGVDLEAAWTERLDRRLPEGVRWVQRIYLPAEK